MEKYIAVYPLGTSVGVGIIEIEHGVDDYAVTEFYGSGKRYVRKNKIQVTAKGEQYIMKYGRKYYIKDFIKTRL